MEDKYISDKVMYIYDQFLETLLMQIRSLYEEYDEIYLDDFELKYREGYKKLINKKLKETKLDKKIKELLLVEPDPYGLDTTENDIKFIISDVFRHIGVELAAESMLIKDNWKEKQVGSLTDKIANLNNLIKENKLEIVNLNKEIENKEKVLKNKEEEFKKQKEKNESLIKERDSISKKLHLSEKSLETHIKQSEQQTLKHENRLIESEKQKIKLNELNQQLENENYILNKNKQSLNKEKEKLNKEIEEFKLKVKELEATIKSINKEVSIKQNDDYINEINKLKKENEHLKKGVDILKLENERKKEYFQKVIDQKSIIDTKNKELTNIVCEKDKEIKLLREKLNKLSSIEVKPKITVEEIKISYNKFEEELYEKLRELVAVESNKIVGGQRVMPIASNINKLAKSIKTINDMAIFKDSLERLIINLSQLDDLFSKNNKDSNMTICINKIKQLKDKF